MISERFLRKQGKMDLKCAGRKIVLLTIIHISDVLYRHFMLDMYFL